MIFSTALLLALIGLIAGVFVNTGIYALAWYSRPISPWQRKHAQAPQRRWSDFLPILGWLGLAREARIHGRAFWVRPLCIELICALGLPALYWWEVETRHLAPNLPILGLLPAATSLLQQQFVSHALLMILMLVATFIDMDEKTIPDEITIPGALLGLLLAALLPDGHLPVVRPIAPAVLPVFQYQPLLLTSSSEWPYWLNEVSGLVLGLAIFLAWCLALIPAVTTLRRGWQKGLGYYLVSIARGSNWWKMLIIAVAGSAAIFAVWRAGGSLWQSLLTSLIGLGFGGGLVWAVRIAGRVALHKEAMGFGDVTLMAMIGAFLGWQPCLMIFAASPFVALIIALAQFVLTGRRDIPYGPYLCASAAAVILRWPWFWERFQVFFQAGWLLIAVLAVCLVLLMGLLMLWRIVEQFYFGS